MKPKSFRQRLSLAINRGARITLFSDELIERDRLAMLMARCETFAANHPMPRAQFDGDPRRYSVAEMCEVFGVPLVLFDDGVRYGKS